MLSPEPRGVAAGLPTPTGVQVRARGQHEACRLYAHLTWHTYLSEPIIRATAAPIVVNSVLNAAKRTKCSVLAQGVLSDHVHILIRCAPDATVSAFVREAKSESSRLVGKTLRWQRGYHADSISKTHLLAVRQYIAAQFKRHPDKIPPG